MTDRNTAQDALRGDNLEDLLPWYVTGRLSKAERDRVEAALAREPELANRLALAVEEQGETVVLNETLGAPSPRTRDELFARIDTGAARSPAFPRILEAIGAWAESLLTTLAPRNLAWSAAAAALVIALQAGVIGALVVDSEAPTFATASQPGAAVEGPRLLIGFVPEAKASEIAGFLQSYRATIVDGPRTGGIFQVRVGDKPLSEPDLQRIVESIRSQTRVVRFAARNP